MTRRYEYDIIKALYEEDNSLLEDLPRWAALYNKNPDRPWHRHRLGGLERSDLTDEKLRNLLKNNHEAIGVPKPDLRPRTNRRLDYDLIRQIWEDNPKITYARMADIYRQKTDDEISGMHFGQVVRNHRGEWVKNDTGPEDC